MKKFVTTVKLNKTIPTYVKHNLGTEDVLIQTYDLVKEQINIDVKVFDANMIEIDSDSPMTIKVVIIG